MPLIYLVLSSHTLHCLVILVAGMLKLTEITVNESKINVAVVIFINIKVFFILCLVSKL